ncbi:uncharacterized protein LOC110684374 [Chenopodium quinoa]|uniref:uncharacterized protein LOC110684374 n=1 Tax=Chenopodium quinoa TaxID=63459 RepID=UPI000B7782E3|nr:uncharacterized protein LOC110684374 [Chenopodium quinoa]XP_021716522.1 uncharacterized protein LOC110684374 [Chenopodium quinoa]
MQEHLQSCQDGTSTGAVADQTQIAAQASQASASLVYDQDNQTTSSAGQPQAAQAAMATVEQWYQQHQQYQQQGATLRIKNLSYKAIFRGLNAMLKTAMDRTDFPVEFTLENIGTMLYHHQYHVSVKAEKLRRSYKKIAALKIMNRYSIRHAHRWLRLLTEKQARDAKILQKTKLLVSRIWLFADRQLAVAAKKLNKNDELGVRNLGDYFVGRRLIKKFKWKGNMRLFLARKDVGVVRDILDEAMFDDLFSRINLVGLEAESDDGAESDAGAESLDDSPKSKFVWEPPSDEEQ